MRNLLKNPGLNITAGLIVAVMVMSIFVPGVKIFATSMVSVIVGLVVFFGALAAGAILGIVLRGSVLSSYKLGWWHLPIWLVSTLLIASLYLWLVPLSLHISPAIDIFTSMLNGGYEVSHETPPYWWAIWGAVTYAIAYIFTD